MKDLMYVIERAEGERRETERKRQRDREVRKARMKDATEGEKT